MERTGVDVHESAACHFMTILQHLMTAVLWFAFAFDMLLSISVVISMLKFAVCDDEPAMVKLICDSIAAYMQTKQGTPYCISTFSNGSALLESPCAFDMIFLDIQMEQPDGLETAKRLRQRNTQCLLVFITILKEYVFDAFEVQAHDYLVKPLDESRFQKMMHRAMTTLEQHTSKQIVIQKGTSCAVIPLSRIVYCEVQGRKVYIHQEGGKIVDYYEKLHDFEGHVDDRFFKCHRSYLVNLDHIRGSHGGQIVLSDGSTIPVSRLRERDLTEALLRYMKDKGC